MDSLDAAVLVWIFCLIVGVLIGWQKGQVVSGIVWPVLFGPLGVIVVACLPNKKKQAQEVDNKVLLMQQMELQRQQLEELKALRQPTPARQLTPTPRIVPSKKFSIYKEGQDLGEMNRGVILTMLQNGQLSPMDYFLDPESNEWILLENFT